MSRYQKTIKYLLGVAYNRSPPERFKR